MRLVVLLLWALLVSPAHAAVITTVEWESKPGAPWDYYLTDVDCAITQSPSGGCALRFTYPAATYASSFPAGRAGYTFSPVHELYVGHWNRYSAGATFNNFGTKMDFPILADQQFGCGNISVSVTAGVNGGFTPQICWGNGSTNYFPNQGVSWNWLDHLDQWHWVEWHVKMGTPGGADTLVETWVDNVLLARYTNVQLADSTQTAGIGSMVHTGEWGGGGGTIPTTFYWWIDHTVISTTPIGMPGGVLPPADTQAPSQVTGVTVTGTTNTTAAITHSASTDNVGVTNYLYELCSPSPCTNFALWKTGTTATTVTLTGLTKNTSYNGRIQARDAAGNYGAYSATFTATTQNITTTRRTLATTTFTRADENPLSDGSTWAGGYTGQNNLQLVSNAVEATVVNTSSSMSLTTALPADQWAEVTIGAATGVQTKYYGIYLRMSAPATLNGYRCIARVNTDTGTTLDITRMDAGVGTDIVTTNIVTPVSGGVMRCEANGTLITASYNDVVIASAVDATYATGRAGLRIFLNTGAALTDGTLDNFSAGDYVTASTAPTIATLTGSTSGATWTYGTTPAQVRLATATSSIIRYVPDVAVRTTVASDDFNRANGAIGSNYTAITGYSTMNVVSNAAYPSAVATLTGHARNDILDNNQWMQVTIASWAASGDLYFDVFARFDPVAKSGYACERGRTAGRNYFSITRWITGTIVQLADGFLSASATAGDTMRIDVIGSTIYCSYNGVVVVAATDMTHTSGKSGMYAYVEVGGATTDIAFDNLLAGNYSSIGTYARSWTPLDLSLSVYAIDGTGVENTTAGSYQTISTAPYVPVDLTPPTVSNITPTGTTSSNVIGWLANELSTCRISPTDIPYASMSNLGVSSDALTFSYTDATLVLGNSYTRYIGCADTSPNANAMTTNAVVSFTYATSADITAPSTVAGLNCTPFSPTQTQCTFGAATDNVAVTGYEASISASGGAYIILNPVWSTLIIQNIDGLIPGTTYAVKIKPFDAAGNRSADFSNIANFVMPALPDTVPPSNPAGLMVIGQYQQSIQLGWTKPTDNSGFVSTFVEQCTPGPCTTGFTRVKDSVAENVVTLNLSPGIQYCFRINHIDGSGNVSLIPSSIVCGTTSTSGLTRPRTPSSIFTPRAPLGRSRTPRN